LETGERIVVPAVWTPAPAAAAAVDASTAPAMDAAPTSADAAFAMGAAPASDLASEEMHNPPVRITGGGGIEALYCY
jgi:hypothetical protein